MEIRRVGVGVRRGMSGCMQWVVVGVSSVCVGVCRGKSGGLSKCSI